MTLSWPIAGASRSTLNVKDKPGEGDGHFGTPRSRGKHSGIDIQAESGTEVLAAGDGVIVAVQPNPSTTYGTQVAIEHEKDKLYTVYCHLQAASPVFATGATVTTGQVIALVGRTGNTPRQGDSHLHFEVRLNSALPRTAGGMVADPLDYLPA